MRQALQEARIAAQEQEIPVGAVVVSGGRVIARGHNMVECLSDCTAHAEILAITAACDYLGSKILPNCALYVTMEPCAMCFGAIMLARIPNVVYGCDATYTDPVRMRLQEVFQTHLSGRISLTRGVLRDECAALVREYFSSKR